MLKSSLSLEHKIFLFLSLFISSVLHGQTWEEKSILKAIKQEVNDNFGKCVAISANYAAVSAEQGTGDNKWSLYIYKRNADNTFSFIQGVQLSNNGYSLKPTSLSLTDNLLVVGVAQTMQPSPGEVLIFEPNEAGKWNEVQKLTPSDGHGLDLFGTSVAVSNNTIVVSSPGKSIEYHEGAIYIFERGTDGQWFEHQKLMASDYHRDDYFGYTLAIQGDVILAGAPYENDNQLATYGHGAVYYIQRDGSGHWAEKQKIISPERKPGSLFGWSIDVFNEEIIIGAEREDHYGTVYFFKRENNEWKFHQRIASPSHSSFGHDVVIENNVAAVSLGDQLAHVVFTYEKGSDGIWKERRKVYSPFFSNHQAESFGNSIDMANELLIVGAPDANASIYTEYNPPRAGEAHIYLASDIPPPFEKQWLDASGTGSFSTLVDFDNDEDLDLFVSYRDNVTRESRLYEFTGSGYSLTDMKFPYMEYHAAHKWIDVNGDGWLDIIMTYEENYEPKTELYINNKAGNFIGSVISRNVLNDTWFGAFNFADYDNDTDPDLLVQFNHEPGESSKVGILINDGKFNFTNSGMTFPGRISGSQPWFDFDNDGFKDFVLSQDGCEFSKFVIYKNSNGLGFDAVLTNVKALTSFFHGSGDHVWGDVDNDGDGDLVWSGVNGCSSGEGTSNVALNNFGRLTALNSPFKTLLSDASLTLTDFNNDGVLDILAYGDPRSSVSETTFLLGSANKFEKLHLYEMPRSYQGGNAVAGDIEGDGDIDAIIAGDVAFGAPRILAYVNKSKEGWGVANLPPSTPNGFRVEVEGKAVTLRWNSSVDDTTPAKALTYNIRILRNDSLVFDNYSNKSGKRQQYVIGNAGYRTSMFFRNMKNGLYKVSVQAIDNGYAGSSFTEVVAFTVPGFSLPPTLITAKSVCEGSTAYLQVSGSDIVWYKEENLTTPIASGNIFEPVIKASDTTFYAVRQSGNSKSTALPVTITVVALIKGNIIQEGDYLVAPTAIAYQWYRNENILGGETSQKLFTDTSGEYFVKLNNGTCETASDKFVLQITDVEPRVALTKIHTRTDGTLIIESGGQHISQIDIYDLSGRRLINISITSIQQSHVIDTSGLRPGMYLVHVNCVTVLKGKFLKL